MATRRVKNTVRRLAGIRCAFVVFLFAGLPGPASAQIAPIKGWQTTELESAGFFLFSTPAVGGVSGITVTFTRPVARGGDFEAWVAESIRQFAALSQMAIDTGPITSPSNPAERAIEAHIASGARLSSLFWAYETSTAWRITSLTYRSGTGESDKRLPPVIAYLRKLARDKRMDAVSLTLPPVDLSPPRLAVPPVAGGAALFSTINVQRAPWLRPGAGIGDGAIWMVIPHLYCSSARGCSLWVYTFLRDGRVFGAIKGSPREFDPAAAGNDVSHGSWRLTGGGVTLDWSDGSREVINGPYETTGAAPPDYRISGTFSANASSTSVDRTYGVTANVYLSTSRTITFRADGTFEEKIVSAGFGDAAGFDSEGGAGRYRIEGYTLQLAYTDGRRDNQLFSIMQKSGQTPTAFVLTDWVFVRK